jgi:hypothetical protein
MKFKQNKTKKTTISEAKLKRIIMEAVTDTINSMNDNYDDETNRALEEALEILKPVAERDNRGDIREICEQIMNILDETRYWDEF